VSHLAFTVPGTRVGSLLGLTVLGLLAAARPAPAQAPQTIYQALLKQAPKMYDYLRQHHAKSVGVLKFLVQEGDGRPSDRVGLLYLALADRTETALVLALPHKLVGTKDCPDFIGRASDVAAALPGANHLTPAGRAALFRGDYALAYGDPKARVKADAFITGVVRLNPDLKQMTVTLQGFHKGGKGLDEIARFTVDSDVTSLVESGLNYHLTGKRGGVDEIITRSNNPKRLGKAAAHPLFAADAPVALEVLYNGSPQTITLPDNGEARVEEPREDQEVAFRVRRREGVKGTLAVVLLVNGENTLFRERKVPEQCAKWILPAGEKELLIKGFQFDEKQSDKFKVLSREDSKQQEVYYGHDVGRLSLVVYREQGGITPVLLNGPTENELAVQGASQPEVRPKNLFALRNQLRSGGGRGPDTRGIPVPGDRVDAPLQLVNFRADPTPVMNATLRYYARQK
jgi:hypothetical protein